MFWFCKTKPINVYFYTTREEVFNHAKPKKAASFIPDWFKKLPRPHFTGDLNSALDCKRNLRTCPGFINVYKSGFIFPLWSDLNIQLHPDGSYRYQFADRQSGIISHPGEQFVGSGFAENYVNLKLSNPWHMRSDKKVNFLFSPPTWNGFGYEDIIVAPGAYSVSPAPGDANVNLFFKKPQEIKIWELFFGQPLVHVVPLSERPLNLHYELVTEKELMRLKSLSPIELMFNNRYRRAEKLCPHA